MRDQFILSDLTDKQKQKLCNFYNVDSVDELEVLENGEIAVKKRGSGKPIKLYLQDHDGKNHELSISDFVNKQKNPPLGYGKVDKGDAVGMIEDFISKIKPSDDKLHQLYVESNQDPQLLLFQQMVIFYSDKLKKVLCGNEINKKFIGASGHPGYSDLDIYNILKVDDGVIIKGFAFCTYPSKGELYIDVICGTGGTGELVRNLYKQLPNINCSYISLEAIETPQALSFYHKLGFKKSDGDTEKTLDAIKKSKAKTFEEFCKKSPLKAGGMMYLGKIPKKIKAKYIYSPEEWFDAIKSGNMPKLGSGLGDFFSGVWNGVKKVANKFSPNLSDFTNQCKAILAKYGQGKVTKLIIVRQPIMGVLDTLINAMTFGAFQDAKKKYGYDKLFHLQLVAYVKVGRGTVRIVLEKNETVDMSISRDFVQTGDKEFLLVDFDEYFTLNDLVNKARQMQGDQKFFEYDAFKNNCQWFISYLLHGQGLYGPEQKAFLFQDMTEFTKDLPKWLPGFARKVTDLGATVSNLRGKGERDFTRIPRDFSRVRKPNVRPDDYKPSVFSQRLLDKIKTDQEAKEQANRDRIKKRQDEANEKVRREFSGGIGVSKYITEEEHKANRDRAIAEAQANRNRGTRVMNPRIAEKARKEREALDNYNNTAAAAAVERSKKKSLKDYQAEERWRKQKEAEQKAEDDQIAANAVAYRKTLEDEAKAKAERKAARVKELSDQYKAKREQLKKDVTAYKEGRIDDIQDLELLSRAQTERNLGFKGDNKKGLSYYQLAEETYKNALRQEQENAMTNLLPTVLQLGVSKIPKVGNFINDIVDATGVKDDTSADARRKAIIERGPPVRPNVLEGYEGEEPTEPDWNDQATKEGYGSLHSPAGKRLDLHAVIVKKPVSLEDAKKEASKIIKNKKFFRETNSSYRFRNIPKQKFEKKSFRTEVINPNLSLIFGKPKSVGL